MKSFRQMSIIQETKSRMDQVYSRELDPGDVFALTLKGARAGKLFVCIENNFSQDSFSNWKGELIYSERTHGNKTNVSTKKTKNDSLVVIFLRNQN